MKNSCCVIFGGSGFLGLIFAKFLLDKKGFGKVYLADIVDPAKSNVEYRVKIFNDERIVFVKCDVRNHINLKITDDVNLICNFAAVHREPGHSYHEYFETNILGAENVCEFSKNIKCNTILFSSSISPYGSDFREKDENTLPLPTSPYGSSKLIAEKIHQNWQSSNTINRLVIVRPGVVFGPGEGGNVSRLIRSLRAGYFIYMGNKKIQKAGVYVFELCEIMGFMLENTDFGQTELVNASFTPNPTLENYVNSISFVLKKKSRVLPLPFSLILVISYIVNRLLNLARITHPFDPIRIKKLVVPNKIISMRLSQLGYEYLYDITSAMQDWEKINSSDWKDKK